MPYLSTNITESSIWDAPSHIRIVWVTMLAMADQRGYVGAAITGVAHRSRVTLEEAQEAVAFLMAPDPHSRTPDHEGRRLEKAEGGWTVLNFRRYQEGWTNDLLRAAEKREEAAWAAHKRQVARERKRRSRERANANVTPESVTMRDGHARSRPVTPQSVTMRDGHASKRDQESGEAPDNGNVTLQSVTKRDGHAPSRPVTPQSVTSPVPPPSPLSPPTPPSISTPPHPTPSPLSHREREREGQAESGEAPGAEAGQVINRECLTLEREQVPTQSEGPVGGGHTPGGLRGRSSLIPETVPTQAEVITEADLRGIPRKVAEDYFLSRESLGWVSPTGATLLKWRPDLLRFAAKWRSRDEQQRPNHAHQSTPPNRNAGTYNEGRRSDLSNLVARGQVV